MKRYGVLLSGRLCSLLLALLMLLSIHFEAYANSEYSLYMGKLNVAAYTDNSKTYYGEKPVAGRTVSAKLSMFDIGESILIGDKIYKVESVLPEVAPDHIMIYFDSRDAALKYGLKTEKVYRKLASSKSAGSSSSSTAKSSAGSSSTSKSSSSSSTKTATSTKSGSGSSSGTAAASSGSRSLGKFTVTAYCNCSQCSGKFAGGPTASGAMPKAGHTIAADTSVLTMGSKVKIDGVTYTVEDVGGGITGNKIDIYFDTHEEAVNYALKTKEVFLVE